MKFAIIFAFITSLIFFLTFPTAEERQQSQDIKYKNGPVILKTNALCTKYEYYDATFWKCADKTIETAETSFGRCHISKKHKDLTVYSPMGTVNMHSNIKDIVKLKQKVEELHTSIIMKSQMYIHNQIKVK